MHQHRAVRAVRASLRSCFTSTTCDMVPALCRSSVVPLSLRSGKRASSYEIRMTLLSVLRGKTDYYLFDEQAFGKSFQIFIALLLHGCHHQIRPKFQSCDATYGKFPSDP